jgi:hypothetical protein
MTRLKATRANFFTARRVWRLASMREGRDEAVGQVFSRERKTLMVAPLVIDVNVVFAHPFVTKSQLFDHSK